MNHCYHKDNGYYKCAGCFKALCSFPGFPHTDNGNYKCAGCFKTLCYL